MCLSEMGIAAGNVSLKASLFLWALCSVAVERVANKFSFIRIEKGEICWNKTQAFSKDWNNSAINKP